MSRPVLAAGSRESKLLPLVKSLCALTGALSSRLGLLLQSCLFIRPDVPARQPVPVRIRQRPQDPGRPYR